MVSLDRWPEVERWLLATLGHPEPDREAFLDAHCPDDLRQLVRRLLHGLEAPHLAGPLRITPNRLRPPEGSPALDEAAPPAAGRIGVYRLVRFLGRGGMGEVFLAERHSPGFPVPAALKVLRADLRTDEMLLRFRRERILLASLDHPSIPRLLDAGTTADGRPYYVMTYAPGVPITAYCALHDLFLEDRLALFEDVCAAVAHLHGRHMVHRDLKPSNVFVGDVDRTRHVWLLDFGVATLTLPGLAAPAFADAGTSLLFLTQEGPAPRTPAYAAPEQLRGEAVT
ncbi:MAG TPA: serine/threonine-protein kinase, partial [Rhodothermales bacterium]|nr:serine/threonine-protein kinase [Rhodothermales bacterium]